MQSVIIGWQVYWLTRNPLSLGLIGLAEAIPFIAMALPAGHIADRYNRRKIIVVAASVYVVCAAVLLLMSYGIKEIYLEWGVLPVYLVISITGVARAFFYPAQSAYMAQAVPRNLYHNSSTWNSTIWHIAAVSGPAVGGLVYGFAGMQAAYITVVIFAASGVCCFLITKTITLPENVKDESVLKSLGGGVRFVFKNQVLLGAMSLDMFGVLFGGAVALLPVFAAEVLGTGPQGLGLLRASPAFGAVIMAMYLAYHPPFYRSGKKLLLAVAGYGLCTVLFALSVNFYLSLFLLALSGAIDNVSVIIRGTILQLVTPDEMRGRVASVNSIFIGSSNELGAFESGLAAKIMGLIPSVIFGGGMTILIAGITQRLAPKLRSFELRHL